MNILVCDDDKEILDAIKIYLQNEGYVVFGASNGREALKAIEEDEIHLVIMDIMMPELDGLRATVKIREDKNIPVIMLSAKSEDTDKIIGLNMGADDYIAKPFNPLELIARVKSQLRRYTRLGSLETKTNVFRTGGLEV
ncbi:MAG: response regulator transcription factor, partial [Syntrophomonas sp.]